MNFAAGFSYAEAFVEGLKRCGRDLTREKLVAEMEKIQNFQGSMSKVSYAPFNPNDPLCRLGTNSVWIGQATADAKMKVLSGWIETEFIPMGE